ncbi:retrovirus-related Pol polyprotein from transposon TNT 1-94, partial [Trifolium pratense]
MELFLFLKMILILRFELGIAVTNSFRHGQLVSTWILSFVSPSISQSVVFMENAIDIWNDLRECFSQGNLIHISELQQEAYALKQDSRSVTNFYTDSNVIWEELELYLPIPSCTCTRRCTCEVMHSACRNHTFLHTIRFLTSLNANFSTVKSQILIMDPLPPINKVFSLVLQHERQCISPESDDSTILVNDARSTPSSSGYKQSTQSSSGSKPPRKCTYCGMNNHFVENCFKKNGVPPHMKKLASAHSVASEEGITHSNASTSSQNSTAASPSISQNQYYKLMSILQNSHLASNVKVASSNQVGSSMIIDHSLVTHK